MKVEESSITGYRLGAVALAVLGAAAAGPVAAQSMYVTPHGYVGANIGNARSSDFNNDAVLRVPIGSVTSRTEDKSDRAFKIYGGAQINPNFAIEGGYYDLGRHTYNYTSSAPAGTFSGSSFYRGLNLDLVGSYPVSSSFSVFGRVGGAYTRASATTSSSTGITNFGRQREDKLGVKFGAGVEYAFTPALSLRGEIERYRVNDPIRNRGHVDVASIGLVYRFGAPAPAPIRTMAPSPPPPPMAPPPPPPAPRAAPVPPPPPAMAPPPPPPPPPPAPAPLPPRPFRN